MITLKIGEQFFTLNDGDVQYIAEAFQIAQQQPGLALPKYRSQLNGVVQVMSGNAAGTPAQANFYSRAPTQPKPDIQTDC
ncbi:Uncharacterised protein [Yersinia intermedia]|uniref:hypothetical protein n=1 Tax=Yersinia TaxID=629 RepID=UPI0005DB171A|nr:MULTISPECIES: hypothetical protein [Yersinia]CQD74344.1 Uncharacterised protein [Yersinia intermedia]